MVITTYVIYDETQYQGKKYNAILIGVFKGIQVNQTYFSDIVISSMSLNHEFVQELLVSSLTKMGLVSKIKKFRLLLTDGVAYNVTARNNLKKIYTKLIHITCYTHMITRISSKMVNTEIGANSLVKHVKKVFEKCTRRVDEWRNVQKLKKTVGLFSHSV